VAAEDYIDFANYDENECVGEVFCKFCQRGPFYWHQVWMKHSYTPRFVLVTARNEVHNCRAATPDEFEDLTNADPQTSSTTAAHRPANRPGHAVGARRPPTRRALEATRFRAKRAARSHS
jgi:hypothetical protein